MFEWINGMCLKIRHPKSQLEFVSAYWKSPEVYETVHLFIYNVSHSLKFNLKKPCTNNVHNITGKFMFHRDVTQPDPL